MCSPWISAALKGQNRTHKRPCDVFHSWHVFLLWASFKKQVLYLSLTVVRGWHDSQNVRQILWFRFLPFSPVFSPMTPRPRVNRQHVQEPIMISMQPYPHPVAFIWSWCIQPLPPPQSESLSCVTIDSPNWKTFIHDTCYLKGCHYQLQELWLQHNAKDLAAQPIMHAWQDEMQAVFHNSMTISAIIALVCVVYKHLTDCFVILI